MEPEKSKKNFKVQISTLDESALDVTKIYIYIYNGINFELRFFERKLA